MPQKKNFVGLECTLCDKIKNHHSHKNVLQHFRSKQKGHAEPSMIYMINAANYDSVDNDNISLNESERKYSAKHDGDSSIIINDEIENVNESTSYKPLTADVTPKSFLIPTLSNIEDSKFRSKIYSTEFETLDYTSSKTQCHVSVFYTKTLWWYDATVLGKNFEGNLVLP